jgi:hypothetical protein
LLKNVQYVRKPSGKLRPQKMAGIEAEAPAPSTSPVSMPAPRSVLAAADPSEEAAYAFKWYLDNLARPSDKVTTLSVEEINDFSFFLKPEDIDELENLRKDELQKMLAKFADEAKEKQVTPHFNSIHFISQFAQF